MKFIHRITILAALLAVSTFGQQPGALDPTKFGDPTVWRLHKRAASVVPDRPDAVRLDAREGDGMAWLAGSDFGEGMIELDLRGADTPGQSFVGIAFRGASNTVYDSIYFRPFNFRNPEEIRRARAVQYVSMPDYPWQRLRHESLEKYEAAVNPVPNPDGWFHARIVVEARKVSVYVNDATEPSLVVTELSERRGGAIGLWVGNGSSGDFANLKIAPKKTELLPSP